MIGSVASVLWYMVIGNAMRNGRQTIPIYWNVFIFIRYTVEYPTYVSISIVQQFCAENIAFYYQK